MISGYNKDLTAAFCQSCLVLVDCYRSDDGVRGLSSVSGDVGTRGDALAVLIVHAGAVTCIGVFCFQFMLNAQSRRPLLPFSTDGQPNSVQLSRCETPSGLYDLSK